MSLSESAVTLHRLQQDRQQLERRCEAIQRRTSKAVVELGALGTEESKREQLVADLKLRVATAKLVLDAIESQAAEAALVTSELRADSKELQLVATQRAAVVGKLEGAASQQSARARQLARPLKAVSAAPKAPHAEAVAQLEENVSQMRARHENVSRLLQDTIHRPQQ
jgi:hypothetical protein